ncbi:MAG: hypothetical protein VKK42_09285 [Lyngbya sp.]|nr:hypothetical protein [Lyngbya sp.]
MNNLFEKVALVASLGLTSTLIAALPGNASVLYDLKFFDDNGNLTGTGVFSHEDEPFEGTLEKCLIGSFPGCSESVYEINASDNYFKVDNFSVLTDDGPFAQWELGVNFESQLFWRPFDDVKLASYYLSGRFDYALEERWVVSRRVAPSLDWALVMSPDGTWDTRIPGPPDFLKRGSGTWTVTQRVSVPEPTSIVGLIAFGVFGIGSVLKGISD